MLKIANRYCPICDNNEVNVLKNIILGEQEYSNLPSSYDVVCCNECGFTYADTTATEEDYNEYYRNCNIYSGSPHKLDDKESAFDIAKNIMKLQLSYDSHIIDIGCGFGDFEIKALKEGYTNIIGIDPSKESIDNLRANNIVGIVGSVYDEPKKDLIGKMDAVFLMAVIEHLLMPKEAIKQAIKYLKPQGKLYIYAPDCGKINENLTPQPNNFNFEHINYFSCISLNRLLACYGYREIFSQSKASKNNSFNEYAIFSVYERDDNVEFSKDINTEKAILEYFNVQEEKQKIRIDTINRLKDGNEKIIIWGTGAFVSNLLEDTNLNECDIVAYVDNNPLKIGKNFNEKEILNPRDIKDLSYTILIASMLYSEDIKNQIKNMKLQNKVIVIK